MMRIFDWYIGRTIFGTIMMTLATLVGLSGIIKFVEQLKKVGEGTYGVWDAGLFTLLTVPADISVFFPMAALLGALLGLGMLASRSELVVMEAAGFTRLQIAMAVMKTAIPLVILTMALGEWGAPWGDQLARNLRAQAIYGGSMLAKSGGLWAKDGDDFIYIERIVSQQELSGVNIYKFNPQHQLQSVLYANSANYTDSGWKLHQIDEAVIGEKAVTGEQRFSADWKTSLSPDKLSVVTIKPESLSISGLWQYIHYLKQTGQETGRYELALWRKVLQPVTVGVMMLLALSFIFGPLRSVTMGARVLTGICFGFVFYVADQIFGPLSLVYHVPAVIGAAFPSVLFLGFSWYLLTRRR